jgi:hypothetical protein
MNCIAMAGSLYQEVNLSDLRRGDTTQTVPVQLASFLMVLAMREVEYRTLYGQVLGPRENGTLHTRRHHCYSLERFPAHLPSRPRMRPLAGNFIACLHRCAAWLAASVV